MLGLLRRFNGWGWKSLPKLSTGLAVLVSTAAFYLWRLGTLTPGLSAAEAAARGSSASLHSITVNPVNAPQRLLQYGFQAAGHHGAFWMRLPSVFFAILFLSMFYLLAKVWFGRVIGLLTTIILATTPWVVLLARSATPDILLLAPIVLLTGYHWLRRPNLKNQQLIWSALVVMVVTTIYIPGLIWILAASALILRKQLLAEFKAVQRQHLLITLLAVLIVVSPLILAVVRDLDVGKSLILWPAHWPQATVIAKSIGWGVLALIWRTPYHIDTIVGRLPILDVTQIVLGVFGVYAMWSKARRQLYLLAGLVGFGLVATAVEQNILMLSLALPALAILMAAGLRYLYVEWRSVFPHNPIPRALAIVIMVVLVSLQVLWGVRYSLAAWPHSVATRQAYVIK